MVCRNAILETKVNCVMHCSLCSHLFPLQVLAVCGGINHMRTNFMGRIFHRCPPSDNFCDFNFAEPCLLENL